MDDIDGHHYKCAPFEAFRIVRKYGSDLTTGSKLELMCRRRAAQLDGREPNRPQAGFSRVSTGKQKRKAVGQDEEASKRLKPTAESSKPPTTPKSAAIPKRAAISRRYKTKYQKESESDEDDDPEEEDGDEDETPSKKSATQYPKPKAASTPRAALKRKSVRDEQDSSDEQESSDDDNDGDSDGDFELKKSTTQSRKRGPATKSRANNKRRKVSPRSKAKEDDKAKQIAPERCGQKADHTKATSKKGEQAVAVYDEFELAKHTKLKHRISTKSIDEANAVPPSYGCTHCPITHTTLEAALSHAQQSNSDMRRWECMGCGVACCHSEKNRFLAHIEVCAPLKNWMKEMNIAWYRRSDSDFLAMTDHSEQRRSWPARNNVQFIKDQNRSVAQRTVAPALRSRYARATAKQGSEAQPTSALPVVQPSVPAAIWNGASWYDHDSEAAVEHGSRRPGVMYQPGTLVPILAYQPPATATNKQGHRPTRLKAKTTMIMMRE